MTFFCLYVCPSLNHLKKLKRLHMGSLKTQATCVYLKCHQIFTMMSFFIKIFIKILAVMNFPRKLKVTVVLSEFRVF